eukprot:CAMPEP_0174718260 /NCGR_PEP_ID=MMETSP1094-20130205/28405_1 /TAXON_ID=156173 /ORGANISM="Chrysochromulina brevifilum, Strain UTEX LB 985" /LENGTH=124 /DNA_ID=CAMNT_0015918317 /DNA_START=30 /DNA_END=404 /DNA_ORIENTATION=+
MPRLLVALLGLLLGQSAAYTLGAVRACAPIRRAEHVTMGSTSLRTGDMVTVISGDDKGTTAKLLAIDLKKGKVLVEGVNVRTKHVKPMKEGETGSLLKKEVSIAISNVKLSDEQPAPAEEAEAA